MDEDEVEALNDHEDQHVKYDEYDDEDKDVPVRIQMKIKRRMMRKRRMRKRISTGINM